MTRIDCDEEAKQLLRTVNASRMINEMSTHASMYIPISIPSIQLPQYVHLDRCSQWHTSALLSVALESITLPTRLRHGVAKHGFFNDLEAALNVNGNQRIAQLQCSVLSPDNLQPAKAIAHGSDDDRTPLGSNHVLVEDAEVKLVEPRLDIDLSYGETRSTSPLATRHDSSDHLFGLVENRRINVEVRKDEAGEDEIACARKRRRFAGLPVTEKFVNPLLSMTLSLGGTWPYGTNAVQVSLLAGVPALG